MISIIQQKRLPDGEGAFPSTWKEFSREQEDGPRFQVQFCRKLDTGRVPLCLYNLVSSSVTEGYKTHTPKSNEMAIKGPPQYLAILPMLGTCSRRPSLCSGRISAQACHSRASHRGGGLDMKSFGAKSRVRLVKLWLGDSSSALCEWNRTWSTLLCLLSLGSHLKIRMNAFIFLLRYNMLASSLHFISKNSP